jgi:hypothetical protein
MSPSEIGAAAYLNPMPLIRRDDLPDKFREDLSGMPDVMTPFKDACERQSKIRPPMPAPSKLPALPADIEVSLLPVWDSCGISLAFFIETATEPRCTISMMRFRLVASQ